MNSPVVFTSEQLTILNTLNEKYLSGEILSFNAANVATGANSVTLNTRNGVAIFTDVLDLDEDVTFTINNSNITAISQPVFISLGYNYNTATGLPQIIGYQTVVGQIIITVRNLSLSVATNANLTISFLT